MLGSRVFCLYYSYVCRVKTMSFDSASGRREPRAGKNLLTRIPVKKVDKPLDISGTLTGFLNHILLADNHILPTATEEPLLLPMSEDESKGDHNEFFFPNQDLTIKRNIIRHAPLRVRTSLIKTSKSAPKDITNSTSTKDTQEPKAIFSTQDFGL